MKQLILLAIAFLSQPEQFTETSKPGALSNAITPAFTIKTITLSTGVELEYAEQGKPGGTAVIMLHGITDSWKSFEGVLPHLPADLHVFALSQRGHGNSSKPVTTYRAEDFANDVAAFMNAKNLSEAVIVGHSMGSTNAQCFATTYPTLTKALVLLGSFADYNKPMMAEFRKVIDELGDPIDSTFIAEFQKSTLTRPISPEMLQEFINESRKVPAHVWKGVAAGWNTPGFLEPFKTFKKPTLIIWGDKDAYCPKEDQLKLNSTIGHSTLLVYEGTGHAIHWEETGRFASDLSKFISKINKQKK